MSSNTLDSSQPQQKLSPTEALWAHVLRKDRLALPPRNLNMPQVPAAPVDRNATSTRILLYDTQARLEQFSSRADSMLKGMQEANHELKTIGMLFEKDRDTLTNDMIDLVNRSQTEIQKAVGKPAQEPQVLAFQEKLKLRVEGLNQRLDALQMFNQTHYQALETHSQTLKSIQDQQTALLSAILPLLPLLQSVPPQIEQLKERIQMDNASASSTMAALKQDLSASLALLRTKSGSGSRKRRLSGHSHGSSPTSLKKLRRDSFLSPSSSSTGNDHKLTHSTIAHHPVSIPAKSPFVPRIDTSKHNPESLSRRRSVFATPQNTATLSPHQIMAIPSRTNSTKPSPLSLRPQPPASSTSPVQSTIASPMPRTPFRVDKDGQCPPPSFLQKPPDALAPHLRAHPPVAIQASVRAPQVRNPHPFRSPPKSTDTAPTIRTTNAEPHSPSFLFQLHGNVPSNQTTIPLKRRTPMSIGMASVVTQPKMTLDGKSIHLTAGSLIPSNMSNNRRSPPRDGRRFIPLDDDDEDDDEEDDMP